MNDNEKLIAEAQCVQQIDLTVRLSPGDGLYPMSARGVQTLRDMIGTLSDALEAAEKAHTPTDDEREALISRLGDEVEYRVRTAVALAKGKHSIEEQVIEGRASVSRIAAGFRRFEVPEPSAEVTHRGTFGHVWPCPLFYVGNWKRVENGHERVRDCTNTAACGFSGAAGRTVRRADGASTDRR